MLVCGLHSSECFESAGAKGMIQELVTLEDDIGDPIYAGTPNYVHVHDYGSLLLPQ